MFWIDGRSGDGKSVLLLQLAASILSAAPETLIYKVAHPDRLPALIGHAHDSDREGRLTLIVAEDLHRLTDPDAFHSALTLTLDRDHLNVAVLACGPTPEKDAFVRANQSVEVSDWTMPSLSDVDLSLFSEWFETRIDKRDALDRFLASRGIHCRRFWFPIHTQVPYRRPDAEFPNSTRVVPHALWLPSAFTLSDEDVRMVCTHIQEFFDA